MNANITQKKTSAKTQNKTNNTPVLFTNLLHLALYENESHQFVLKKGQILPLLNLKMILQCKVFCTRRRKIKTGDYTVEPEFLVRSYECVNRGDTPDYSLVRSLLKNDAENVEDDKFDSFYEIVAEAQQYDEKDIPDNIVEVFVNQLNEIANSYIRYPSGVAFLYPYNEIGVNVARNRFFNQMSVIEFITSCDLHNVQLDEYTGDIKESPTSLLTREKILPRFWVHRSKLPFSKEEEGAVSKYDVVTGKHKNVHEVTSQVPCFIHHDLSMYERKQDMLEKGAVDHILEKLPEQVKSNAGDKIYVSLDTVDTGDSESLCCFDDKRNDIGNHYKPWFSVHGGPASLEALDTTAFNAATQCLVNKQ